MTDIEKQTRSLVGDRIRRARVKRGLTQQIIADRVGLSIVAYRDIERGKSAGVPSLHRAARLLKLPGVYAVESDAGREFRIGLIAGATR